MLKRESKINLPTLADGFHNLFIRSKDENGIWSMYEGRVFYVQPTVGALTAAPVVSAEYFFDTDPGVSKGTLLNSFTSSGSIELNRKVSVSGLTEGFHNVFFRTKDSNGKWSMYEGRVIYVQPSITNTTAEEIVAAEYFFDTDPGVGQGTLLSSFAANTSISLNRQVSVTGLTNGFHNLFVRVKSASGKWSTFEVRTLYVQPTVAAATSLQLVAAEYFFNQDPGFGKGIAINTGASTDALTMTLPAVSTNGLVMGANTIYIRVKDQSGKWSLVGKKDFSICATVLAAPVVTGNTTLCAGKTLDLSVNAVNGATGYTWTGPNNFSANTQTIAISNVGTQHVGDYIVVATNGTSGVCGTGNSSKSTVVVNAVPGAVTGVANSRCGSGSVSLSANGSDTIKWFAAASGGDSIATGSSFATPILSSSTTYYVSSNSALGCEGPRSSVTASIKDLPAAPTGAASQSFVSGKKVSDLAVTGTNVKWYASASDAAMDKNVLEPTELLVNSKTYYATQTLGECPSLTSLPVTVTINSLGTDDLDADRFACYPNPTHGIFNLEFNRALTSVKVFNVIGQLVTEQHPNATAAKVDISAYQEGVYFVEVKADEMTKIIKVIKTN